MGERKQTKKQLTEKIKSLYSRIAELEKVDAEHTEVEYAPEENLNRYKRIFENMEEAYFEIDLAGNLTFFNDASCSIMRYPADELMGMNNRQYVSPETAKRMFQIFSNIYQTGISEKILNHEVIRKDGDVRILEMSASVIRNSSGAPIGFRGLACDVTERKRAEESLSQSLEKLRRATGSIIDVIVMAVETRDPYTAGHQKRVTKLARSIAAEMRLSTDHMDGIRMAGQIHDLGKISIPAEILSKPRRLNDVEYSLVKTHPEIGYRILKDIAFSRPVALMVYQHHERMNGSGYPQGIKGEEILLEARILAVADVVEAICTHRPYRPAWGIDKALKEIFQYKGVLYDPEVVDACIKLFREKGFRFE